MEGKVQVVQDGAVYNFIEDGKVLRVGYAKDRILYNAVKFWSKLRAGGDFANAVRDYFGEEEWTMAVLSHTL